MIKLTKCGPIYSKLFELAATLLLLFTLSGCSPKGWLPSKKPKLNPIEIPVQRTPESSLMEEKIKKTNSLWQQGSVSYLTFNRTFKEGDLIRVVLKVQDAAKFEGGDSYQVSSTHDNPFLDAVGMFIDIVPEKIRPTAFSTLKQIITKAKRSSSQRASSNVDRKESLKSEFTVVVKEVLCNGNLLISGSQEILVNREKRELRLTGIIRQRDILADNSIESDKIAEARIYYGGAGAIN